MLLEKYLDMGILLYHLMSVSQGVEITFGLGKIIVTRRDGTIKEVVTDLHAITIHSIECAIEAARGD